MKIMAIVRLSLTLAISFVISPQASALSCGVPPFEYQYLQSKYVFVAEMVSVKPLKALDWRQHPSGERKWKQKIRVAESFKDPVTFDRFETGSAWPRANAHFKEGELILFFMDDSKTFGICSPKYLVGTEPTTTMLKVLRDYQSGKRKSVAGSWTAHTDNDRCSVGFVDYLPKTHQRYSFNFMLETAGEDRRPVQIHILGIRGYELDTQPREGVTIEYGGRSLSVPYNEKIGRYRTNVPEITELLSEILADQSPLLKGQTPGEGHFDIGLHLNGDSKALFEFAQCADLTLKPTN